MKFDVLPLRSAMVLATALAAAGAAQAQQTGWRPFISVTPVYQGKGQLDGGGQYSAASAIVRAGASNDLGRGSRAAVTLNYDYTDYSFTDPVRFGGVAPWNIVQRYGMSGLLSFGLSDGWGVGLVPSFDWFLENGAKADKALTWGGIVSATKRFDDGNRLGFGMGGFEGIEKTSIFPFLLVDWRINDRWRLMNPLPAGPTGPAGLEIEYRFDGGWNVGLGAAWRSTRFRLSKDGAVPNGIGEERGVPLFLRATQASGELKSLNLYAGIVTNGQFRVADSSGNEMRKVDFNATPIFGVTFLARF
jgi:hypothetical protein